METGSGRRAEWGPVRHWPFHTYRDKQTSRQTDTHIYPQTHTHTHTNTHMHTRFTKAINTAPKKGKTNMEMI